MISVNSLARGYSSFWAQVTPWLSGYVSYINKGHLERICPPLELSDDPKIRAINNTVAFYKFVERLNKKADDCDYAEAKNKAFNYLKSLPRNNIHGYELTDCNLKIIKFQVDRLYNQYAKKNILVHPVFPGSGIIFSSEGDLYYGDTLIEIKAGERDLAPSDIKQLLIYSALNFISNKSFCIKNVELYNPRQGVRYFESLDNVGLMISDRSIEEIFLEISSFSETHCLTSH